MQNETKKILGASIGNCVHVAGVVHFLNLAEAEGYKSIFLGPAIPIEKIIENIKLYRPDYVALGYRLTPENVLPLIDELKQRAESLDYEPLWIFGGTRPVAALAKQTGFFDKVYDSTEDLDDCIAFLRGMEGESQEQLLSGGVVDRIAMKQPYPLLRHHFGLPSFSATLCGVSQIAESRVLDVISLGPDQNTQQFYFHPELADPSMDGAGGVPIRSREDFLALKSASQTGNYPLMRCYSGTADVFEMAELLEQTIDNAWCAVPLTWYNEVDGRGTRTIEASIDESQRLMAWHGARGIPVEINEPHHWGLRDAHDTISVVMAYLSAYNAKAYGVKDYIAQYMFNVPNALSFSMDLAKVLAMIELVESLAEPGFNIYRQTRAGLPFLSSDTDVAKGQLAASTMLQMSVSPHIIHVVGYSEAEQAATPDIVIESCRIVRGVIRSVIEGGVAYAADERVLTRKAELLSESRYLLDYIKAKFSDVSDDPFASADVLAECIKSGVIDAPHIVKNKKFRGILKTRIIDGKCLAWDEKAEKPLSEKERLETLERHDAAEMTA